jgi:hypothetical protein
MVAWDQADFVALPLLDGTQSLAQIVEVRDCPPDAVYIALTLLRVTDPIPPLTLDDIVALLFTGTAHLANSTWPVLGFDTLPVTDTLVSYKQTKRAWQMSDTPATMVADPVLVESFVNACHGLLPWDLFPDPAIFDRMLARKGQRPPAATFAKP